MFSKIEDFLLSKEKIEAAKTFKFSDDDKRFLNTAYEKVFKRQLSKGCGSCYQDAFLELYNMILQNKNQMEKQTECRYRLKNGVILRINGRLYNNTSLTDKVAEKYLKDHPDHANKFSYIPGDQDENADSKEVQTLKGEIKRLKEQIAELKKEKTQKADKKESKPAEPKNNEVTPEEKEEVKK